MHRRIDIELVIELRNAASRIRSGNRLFTEVVNTYGTVDDLREVLYVVTALVASQICDETLDAKPPAHAVRAVVDDLDWTDGY